MGFSKIVARVTNASGRPFHVVLVKPGDCYGRYDELTHEGTEPLVEFWDASYAEDPRFTLGRGQFVSRYYLSTLTGADGMGTPRPAIEGLRFCGHDPVWRVTGENVVAAIAAVRAILDPATLARDDHERRMFGCTMATIEEALMGKTPRDIAMYAMSALSNAQEFICHRQDGETVVWVIDDRHVNTVRQLMNVAKYAIDKAVPR